MSETNKSSWTGARLWSVDVEEIETESLWILADSIGRAITKATAHCKAERSIEKPTIREVRYHGTIDA